MKKEYSHENRDKFGHLIFPDGNRKYDLECEVCTQHGVDYEI